MKYKSQFYRLSEKIKSARKNCFEQKEYVKSSSNDLENISPFCVWKMIFSQSVTLKIVRNFIIQSVKILYEYKNSNFQVQLIRTKNKTPRQVH